MHANPINQVDPWKKGRRVMQAIGEIEQLVSTFNIPVWIATPVVRLFFGWCLKSGEEWAVSRMKDYQVNLVRMLAGELPMYTLWTSLCADGVPKGPVGGLFRWVLASPSRKRRLNAITLLRMYTRFTSSDVTAKQERKFLSGVCALPTPVPVDLGRGLVAGLQRLGVPRAVVGLPRPLATMIPNPKKRHPLPDGRTYPETENLLLSRSFLSETHLGRELQSEFGLIFRAVCEGLTYERSWDGPYPTAVYPDSVGKIGLIQEPGFKLRAVANPGRVYQQALRPLGGLLFRTLSHLPWDCTYDQSRPMCALQEALKSGHTLHCVDLQGATDYFPLALQLPVLDWLTLNRGSSVRLFERLSTAPWIYGEGTIRWNRGQPLGLFPSFAAFSITHGALLYHLNAYRHDNRFFVLGDDVVILDDTLAMRYKEVLADLGCPVSQNKTLDSPLVGEFAGKLVFPDIILPQLKWKDASDDSFVDFARHFGMRALRLLRPRQRKVIKAICDIPEFLGGLGWNPSGVPLEERVAKYYRLFGGDEVSGSFLTGYNELFGKHAYGHAPYNSLGKVIQAGLMPEMNEYLVTFDQKVRAITAKELPLLVEWCSILGRNLMSVAPETDLPMSSGESQFRRTMLEVLEQKLG